MKREINSCIVETKGNKVTVKGSRTYYIRKSLFLANWNPTAKQWEATVNDRAHLDKIYEIIEDE